VGEQIGTDYPGNRRPRSAVTGPCTRWLTTIGVSTPFPEVLPPRVAQHRRPRYLGHQRQRRKLRNPTPGPVSVRPPGPPALSDRSSPKDLAHRVGELPASARGAPVNNPTSGPIFRQAVRAIRSIIPQTFSKGRIGSNAGAPIVIPPIIFYELNGVQRHWQSRQPYPNLVSSTPTQPVAVPVKAIIDGYPADLTSSSVQLAFTRGYGVQPSTLIPATWQAGYTAGWHNAVCLVGTVPPRHGRRDIAYGGDLDGLGAGGGRCRSSCLPGGCDHRAVETPGACRLRRHPGTERRDFPDDQTVPAARRSRSPGWLLTGSSGNGVLG
jgi:hypothetical protein